MDHEHQHPLTQEKSPMPKTVSLKERLHHFTWAWFTLTMSTGSIALLLSSNPHRFRGFTTSSTIIFILDLLLFALSTCAITTRFLEPSHRIPLHPYILAKRVYRKTPSNHPLPNPLKPS